MFFFKITSLYISFFLLSGCFATNGDVNNFIGDSDAADTSPPEVSVSAPSPTSGDASSTFTFNVTVTGADTINLTAGDITVNASGTSCGTPVVTGGTTANPTITISNCASSGTVSISVNTGVASDSAGNQSVSSSNSADATVVGLVCPTNYVLVPGNAFYGTSDFCVMKYEAKLQFDTDGDGDFSSATVIADGNFDNARNYDTDYDTPSERAKYKPVSVVTGRPWVRINRGENGASTGQGALEACQNLNNQEGTTNQYDLITNDEWQTLARNIEAQKSGATNNWGIDSFSDLVLNHGHADNNPSQSCDASNEYVDGNCANSGNETDYQAKRTHNLSNGEVIWDVAGNVLEWVKDNNTNSYGSNNYSSQITSATHPSTFSLSGGTTTTARNAKDQFGPLDDYTGSSTNNRAGLGYLFSSTDGAVLRGGYWSDGALSGVFALLLDGAPTVSNAGIGFRCVFRSP